MTDTPEAISTSFYNSFKNKDAKGMIKNYHPNLKFSDPAFGDLSYSQACAMWEMLCGSAKDLSIEFTILDVSDSHVKTQWIAEYTFSKTNRHVRNDIVANMAISEGKIIEHIDVFNLHTWAKQAMGFKGWLLGNTSFFKNKLHETTGRQLKKYMENN